MIFVSDDDCPRIDIELEIGEATCDRLLDVLVLVFAEANFFARKDIGLKISGGLALTVPALFS